MKLPQLSTGKRLVIKIGSALLVDESNGQFYQKWFEHFIDDIVELYQRSKEIIIVSSGAISLGRQDLGFKSKQLELQQQQAAAATGQIRLAHAFQNRLSRYTIPVAQILLTLEDSENRRRYLNAKNTIETLLKVKAIPVINENDTVATAEIRYGDNDRLAARVAQMTGADRLVLLSDIDGLYTKDPKLDKKAQFIPVVNAIDAKILAMATDSSTDYGSGGMVTKIAAAQIASDSGCYMLITNGKIMNPLANIDKGQKSTWFLPQTTISKARKNWIRHHLKPHGRITINDGAAGALVRGKSLLAAGVTALSGQFQKGDVLAVYNQHGDEIARGLSNYPAHDARKIIGKSSANFKTLLGYLGSEELIHRNNLVVLKSRSAQPGDEV